MIGVVVEPRSSVARLRRKACRRGPQALASVACSLAAVCLLTACRASDENAAARAELPVPVRLASSAESPLIGPPPKHLILISMDTVRADHLGCYGYSRRTSDRLDAFARRGALFWNCVSASSWTVPAHMSIFTGLSPAAHGCTYYPNPGRLDPHVETIQRILQRNGFRTGAFTGGGYLSERYGMFEGFDTFSSRGTHFRHNIPDALKWVDAGEGAPMFLFLHGFDAHKPYLPPREYRKRFTRGNSGKYPVARFCKPGFDRPSDANVAYVVAQYDAEIAAASDDVADFLDQLAQRGVLQDALVIITTDHGDEFYEHNNCDHVHSLYDELIRAAWIMVGPSVPRAVVRDHVGTIDILPTILEIFRIRTDLRFQGVSRVPLLATHPSAGEDPLYAFTGRDSDPYHLACVRTGRWKLITDLTAGSPNPACRLCVDGGHAEPQLQLFDLLEDPGEQRNIAGAYPEFAQELLGHLRDHLAESRRLGLITGETPPQTPEDIERLRSLGYIE